MANEDIRWRQRFQNFNKALGQLSKAGVLAKERGLSELEKQGLIKAFEFTHELAWNTLKDYFKSQGVSTRIIGSKDATRMAFKEGLIEDGEEWMAMIQSRNQTVHTYSEATMEAIVAAILDLYLPEFQSFQSTFQELERKEV